MSEPLTTWPPLTGIVQANVDINQDEAEELMAKWREWADGPRSAPLILGPMFHFRAMRPDGTLEPEWYEPVEMISNRDWAPYIVALSGWVVALIAVLVR